MECAYYFASLNGIAFNPWPRGQVVHTAWPLGQGLND